MPVCHNHHRISIRRPAFYACVILLSAAGAAAQQASTQVAGQNLALRAKATRSMLFGAVDLYSVGIYTAQPVSTASELRDPQLAKAVRVGVLYEGGMPGEIPSDWWQELVPALGPSQEKKLREAFSRLSGGDDVWVTYAPSQGTAFVTGGRTIVSTDGHQLMGAVLDLWLDATPVSQSVHDALVSGLRNGG